MTVIVADALPDIRAFLRNHPDLAPLHGERVFFRVPPNNPTFPLLRIYRHGGAIQNHGGDANISDLLVTVEAWHDQFSGYPAVRQLVVALESALWQLDGPTPLNPPSGATAIDAVVTNVIDAPDPDSGWPRLVANTRWTIRGLPH